MTTKRLVISSALLLLFMDSTHADDTTLKSLSDSELSEVQGQALMNLTYTDPSKANTSMTSQNIGFYKLGMEADVELNANINKLQLGCGGVNGAGGCDIDIDHLSLSGIADTREGRIASSAKMTNPFIEFAIKNPNSASTREMMGFRLSAEKVLGMLTLGEENTGTPNGINSLSGYMKIKDTTGTASTTARNMSYADTGMSVDGKIKLGILPTLGFTTTNYNLGLQSTTATLNVKGTTLAGNRMTHANLKGNATIDQLNFGGGIYASVKAGLLNIPVPIELNATGNITGLTADLNISENLGFIHKLSLSNPFSLSLQKQKIHWNGANVAAERGWWLAIEDDIDIGKVIPSNSIDVTNDILKQVVPSINSYLANNTVNCPGILGLACVFDEVPIGNVNLSGSKPLDFPIKDLQLATQNFAPNCYGSLKFC